jgi:hypothetical protein
MSAEESDEHQALPLLDPNAVIRPLEMDLHGVCVRFIQQCVVILTIPILTPPLSVSLPVRFSFVTISKTSRCLEISLWRRRHLVCLSLLWQFARRRLFVYFRIG